jgi:uncharacterized protein YbjT (DUF2867 family)
MSKQAIVLGATGLTGGILLQKLLQDDRYDQVKVFVRKPMGMDHSKLSEYIVDLLKLEEYMDDFTGDEVYCCIGTTAKKTPEKAQYKLIDYGIPIAAAKLCKANHMNTLIVVSALGADAQSNIFYNKTKGEMEQEVLNLGISNTHILRPSIITGPRGEFRPAEKVGITLMKLMRPIFRGKWKKYRAVAAENIVLAMIKLANGHRASEIVESDSIQSIAMST